MTKKDAYEKLAEMFNQLPPGISYIPSIMQVLRLQYTSKEAELAVKVGLKGIKLDEVQRRTGIDKQELNRMLNRMADKGTMWITPGEENPNYRSVGIGGPGLIETGAWGNIRFPYSVQLLKAMARFQREWATKAMPALGFPTNRVWPSPAALPDDAQPSDNVAEMMKQAGYWSVSTCSCRLPHWVAAPGDHCNHILETCLILGKMGRWCVEHGMAREISYDRAVDLLKRCNEDGLVHTYDPSWAICNCCADCCVFFVSLRETGANVLQRSNFVAHVDQKTCAACGTCADRCPVDAIVVDDFAVINKDKCLGCGVCFPTCATRSVCLVRRSE
jgi:NAD-dependent dihydropyrimidine dehydrogenase PreA subunit